MSESISEIKSGVDLAALVALELGPPAKRSGRWLSWRCPFHHDRTPSFGVTSDDGRYTCFGCGESGDAVDFLMKRRNITIKEAITELRRFAGLQEIKKVPTLVTHCAASQDEPPNEQWQHASRDFAAWAAEQLWTDAGAPGRAYLQGGGLSDETIRRWGLGYNPRKMHAPAARWGLTGKSIYLPCGVVIPASVDGVLWYVKTRRFAGGQPATDDPKYLQIRGGTPALFGSDELQADGRPLLLCEGERDALLAWQELSDLVDVATLGGAGVRHPGRWLLRLLPYRRILAAFDTDKAGREGADWWAGLSYRVLPLRLPHSKDLTEFRQAGGDLRIWLKVGLGHYQTPEVTRKLTDARDWVAEANARGIPSTSTGFPTWEGWYADLEKELTG